jgi:hypothetical protein
VEEMLLTAEAERDRLTSTIAEFQEEAEVLQLLLDMLEAAEGEAKPATLRRSSAAPSLTKNAAKEGQRPLSLMMLLLFPTTTTSKVCSVYSCGPARMYRSSS